MPDCADQSEIPSLQEDVIIPHSEQVKEDQHCYCSENSIEEKYVMREQLGSGGYSTVWRATCKETRNRHALKCIDVPGESEYWCAIGEFRIQSSLKHPNILKVFECIHDEESSKIYIACEICDRGSLEEMLESTRQIDLGSGVKGLPQHQVASYSLQILRALSYMHERFIAHRDLKPQNMMVSASGNSTLKLIDFGFARECKDDGKMFSEVGTPMYTAPEVLSSATSGYTQKCDVWSIGVALFTLCVNDSPFAGAFDCRKGDEVRAKIVANEVVYHTFLWDDVHPMFKEMTQTCLTHSALSRPAADSVLSMYEDWLLSMQKASNLQACCTIA